MSSMTTNYVYIDKEGQDDQTLCNKYGQDPKTCEEFVASCKIPSQQVSCVCHFLKQQFIIYYFVEIVSNLLMWNQEEGSRHPKA